MVMGHKIHVQILHLFQLIFKNLSFDQPLNGNPQEFIFCFENAQLSSE
jgi:hypothetical protein